MSGALAREVFALDDAVQWIALEQAGCEPRWVWRDPETGELRGSAAADGAELVDPLLLMLAEGHDGDGGSSHALRFVVLAYADRTQIVARFGPDAHVSVGADRRADAYALGTRVAALLERRVRNGRQR